MRLFIISFSGHRIDELLADLAAKSLRSIGHKVVRDFPTAEELTKDHTILIFNGINEATEHCTKAYTCLLDMNSYYFIDDHTTWVPDSYECDNIITQFKNLHPVHNVNYHDSQIWTYWPISRLGSLLPKISSDKEYNFVYWGHYKPERWAYYAKHIPALPNTLIIGDKEEWPAVFLTTCSFAPYTRDMGELYNLISKGKTTMICGDDYHNMVNLPLRYYEALACGVDVIIDKDLGKYEDFKVLTDNKIGEQLEELFMGANPTHTTTDVDKVLEDRGKVYGLYIDGVKCRADILEALCHVYKQTHNGDELPYDLHIMYGDLILKLMRSASDPSHLDSWIDLAGYAKLIKETME